ncbi:stage III sporulation protein AF [Pseudoneobacillus rhizosphaerae]|uniref:Stage III sporulation protein AF n=1 Tax=Pseudoneobacillus rhizosphaerae TaxID=2880968 RepID=A0A9C7GBG4_9BACI|nr:stage III sporulation protein AF [Pseudoneobacillus rhizosphaerae]CAG9609311.1 Stage III sporulation protein AF [Pseudoneobacillus rhizosphaerae]
MQFLTEWVTNIIIFVLLATVIDMLLPNTNLQKYTKIVTGLLLIAIILTPVLKLISKDFETALQSIPIFEGTEEKNMENLIELKKKEIQASQRAYILETMAVQLKEGTAEELMNQYGLEVANIDITLDETTKQSFPDNLQKVIVQLKQSEEEANVVAVIKPVEINTNQPSQTKRLTAQSEEITSLLAERWNVSEGAIEVLIEGEVTDNNGP